MRPENLNATSQTFEGAILAALLVHGREALDQVPDLTAPDFEHSAHRDVFGAIARVVGDGLAVSYPTVGEACSGNSSAIKVLAELATADEILPSMLPAYVRQLRIAGAFRRTLLAARKIAALERSSESAGEKLAAAQRLAQGILAGAAAQADCLISLEEITRSEIEAFDRIRSGGTEPERIRTGLVDVDRKLNGGLEPGSLVVIGGDTSSGKSSLCGQLAAAEARRRCAVVFVTSEMAHRQMLVRIVSGLSGVEIERLINRRAAAEAKLDPVFARFGDLPIWFQRSFPPRIEEAVSAIRTAKARHGAKLAMIDYAQRLAEHDEDSQEQAIARIAHEAKNLALELGIVVVAAAQVNRQVAHRTDPRPKLSDLRGSGRLEQDADVVLFTYQPARYGRPGDPEIIVAKNRNGRLGTVKVHFRGETCTFHGLEEQGNGDR
jgi:replicative DNA helicase